ncbi:myrosinase 1-like [Arctopsyche grandis]|uniref:myrosinase 1-like n=1 Tax=Arctopsyche grandis TaxID=121162 RepID=UPI00406D7145
MVSRTVFFVIILISECGRIFAYKRKFPNNFSFGAATASYQIEGGWNASDKSENIWDDLTHNTNLVVDKTNGDVACNSYNLYKRDVEMLTELGVDFYRFSLSWSRILPTGFSEKISDDGLKYYNAIIDNLLEANVTPIVTIYHWDLPKSLQDLGGWTNPLMADYFADFSNVVFEAFGDRVKTWLTFNEPLVFCQQGYGGMGKAPALNLTGVGEYLSAHTVLKAHAKVYHLYDENFRPAQKGRISMTISGQWYEPDTDSPEDLEAALVAEQFDVGWFGHPIFSKEGDYPNAMKERIMKRSEEQGYTKSRLPEFTAEEIEYIKGTYDFLGLNHYTTYSVKANGETNFVEPSFEHDRGVKVFQEATWPSSASSWLKVVPWGFTKMLKWIRSNYANPEVMVFENGFSDNGTTDDQDRINYHRLYLNAMLDAVDSGCNITAYTVWSLMDNMEWLRGYTELFGLYRVDFNDTERKRTPKSSAFYYRDVIKDRAVEHVKNKDDDDFDISLLL